MGCHLMLPVVKTKTNKKQNSSQRNKGRSTVRSHYMQNYFLLERFSCCWLSSALVITAICAKAGEVEFQSLMLSIWTNWVPCSLTDFVLKCDGHVIKFFRPVYKVTADAHFIIDKLMFKVLLRHFNIKPLELDMPVFH